MVLLDAMAAEQDRNHVAGNAARQRLADRIQGRGRSNAEAGGIRHHTLTRDDSTAELDLGNAADLNSRRLAAGSFLIHGAEGDFTIASENERAGLIQLDDLVQIAREILARRLSVQEGLMNTKN